MRRKNRPLRKKEDYELKHNFYRVLRKPKIEAAAIAFIVKAYILNKKHYSFNKDCLPIPLATIIFLK